MKKITLIAMVILVLPIFLHVYNPSLHLGSLGLLVGVIGMTISPIVVVYLLWYYIRREWR